MRPNCTDEKPFRRNNLDFMTRWKINEVLWLDQRRNEIKSTRAKFLIQADRKENVANKFVDRNQLFESPAIFRSSGSKKAASQGCGFVRSAGVPISSTSLSRGPRGATSSGPRCSLARRPSARRAQQPAGRFVMRLSPQRHRRFQSPVPPS